MQSYDYESVMEDTMGEDAVGSLEDSLTFGSDDPLGLGQVVGGGYSSDESEKVGGGYASDESEKVGGGYASDESIVGRRNLQEGGDNKVTLDVDDDTSMTSPFEGEDDTAQVYDGVNKFGNLFSVVPNKNERVEDLVPYPVIAPQQRSYSAPSTQSGVMNSGLPMMPMLPQQQQQQQQLPTTPQQQLPMMPMMPQQQLPMLPQQRQQLPMLPQQRQQLPMMSQTGQGRQNSEADNGYSDTSNNFFSLMEEVSE